MSNEINHPSYHRDDHPVAFLPATLEKVHGLIARYPEGQQKSALLPILHIAQEELGGHLTIGIMDYVAGLLSIKPVEVYEVATFYSMFFLDKVGRYVVEVCQTGPCTLCGGEQILAYLEEQLGIRCGETTPDGLITLRGVECLGGCGNAPVMQINNQFYEHLTTGKIDQILATLRTDSASPNESGTRWTEQFS